MPSSKRTLAGIYNENTVILSTTLNQNISQTRKVNNKSAENHFLIFITYTLTHFHNSHDISSKYLFII